jgi:hypothetical protein
MTNHLVPLRNRLATSANLTRREADFHPSAERCRERANSIRRSLGATMSAEERTKLLEEAGELEQLASSLEQMRLKRSRWSR